MPIQSVLVVYKRTAYQRYCEDERDPRILQLISEDHFTIQEMRKAHLEHRDTLERVGKALEQLKVSNKFVKRADLRDTGGHDLVISLGGDGTFLDTSHHVRDTPMLGVNSSPSGSIGVFCGATGKTFRAVMQEILSGALEPVVLNRVGLVLNGHAIAEPVLNEALICNQNPAATARYVIEVLRKKEHHKSSGVYIGPAAGSTAVMRSAGGPVLPLEDKTVEWVVREQYIEPGGKSGLAKGIVPPKGGMRVHSKMRNGMIYIDGPNVRYRLGFGDEVQVIPDFMKLNVYAISSRSRSAARAGRTKSVPKSTDSTTAAPSPEPLVAAATAAKATKATPAKKPAPKKPAPKKPAAKKPAPKKPAPKKPAAKKPAAKKPAAKKPAPKKPAAKKPAPKKPAAKKPAAKKPAAKKKKLGAKPK